MPKKTDFILMSIKPRFVEKIYSGRKTVEYRKTQPHRYLPILIYETAPMKLITGIVPWWDLKGAADPETVWKLTSAHGGISKPEFDTYYAHSRYAIGLRFHDVQKLERPIALSELGIRAPQSYRYVSLPADLMYLIPPQKEDK